VRKEGSEEGDCEIRSEEHSCEEPYVEGRGSAWGWDFGGLDGRGGWDGGSWV